MGEQRVVLAHRQEAPVVGEHAPPASGEHPRSIRVAHHRQRIGLHIHEHVLLPQLQTPRDEQLSALVIDHVRYYIKRQYVHENYNETFFTFSEHAAEHAGDIFPRAAAVTVPRMCRMCRVRDRGRGRMRERDEHF